MKTKHTEIKTISLKEAIENYSFTDTSLIEMPYALQSFLNFFAETGHQNLIPKELSGRNLQKIFERPGTLIEQVQHNALVYWNKMDENEKHLATQLFRKDRKSRFAFDLCKKYIKLFPVHFDDIVFEILKEQASEIFIHDAKIYQNGRFDPFESYVNNYNIPVSIQSWLREYNINVKDEIRKSCERLKSHSKMVEENGMKMWYVPEIFSKLAQLKKLLQRTKFTVIQGFAGTGKSTYVIEHLKSFPMKKAAICTLSNTIGMMFKNRLDKRSIDCFSIVLANIYFSGKCKVNKFQGYDFVVIDEFSQWGVETLDTLINILLNNPQAEIFFMGDIKQIPTFLSAGSLHATLIHELSTHPEEYAKGNLKIFKEFHRFPEKSAEMLSNVLAGKSKFAKIEVKYLFNIENLEEFDVIITGTNDHVKMLNLLMLVKKFKIDQQSIVNSPLSEMCHKLKNKEIQLISKNTFEVDGNIKIFSNERFVAKASPLNCYAISLTSQLTGKTIILCDRDVNKNFNLGYAITVNKAQGLEWEKSLVFVNTNDRNLQNLHAFYVALSRSKGEFVVATLAEENPKTHQITVKTITSENIQTWFGRKFKFMNLFEDLRKYEKLF